MADDKEILEMIKEIGAMVREEEKNIGSTNNIIKRMEEGAGKDILKATLEASEDTLIKHKCLINWLVELRTRRNAEEWTRIEDGVGKTLQRIEQWQELKETIIELRDNDGTGTQHEICELLTNMMDILEKQMIEPCEDCVSRQAVIDCLIATGLKKFDFILDARGKIKNLPPVTPQPKTGHWIRQADDYHDYYECEQCGIAVGLDDIKNYCPNCGAKMEVEEEV